MSFDEILDLKADVSHGFHYIPKYQRSYVAGVIYRPLELHPRFETKLMYLELQWRGETIAAVTWMMMLRFREASTDAGMVMVPFRTINRVFSASGCAGSPAYVDVGVRDG